jgi:hypothetical protein
MFDKLPKKITFKNDIILAETLNRIEQYKITKEYIFNHSEISVRTGSYGADLGTGLILMIDAGTKLNIKSDLYENTKKLITLGLLKEVPTTKRFHILFEDHIERTFLDSDFIITEKGYKFSYENKKPKVSYSNKNEFSGDYKLYEPNFASIISWVMLFVSFLFLLWTTRLTNINFLGDPDFKEGIQTSFISIRNIFQQISFLMVVVSLLSITYSSKVVQKNKYTKELKKIKNKNLSIQDYMKIQKKKIISTEIRIFYPEIFIELLEERLVEIDNNHCDIIETHNSEIKNYKIKITNKGKKLISEEAN